MKTTYFDIQDWNRYKLPVTLTITLGIIVMAIYLCVSSKEIMIGSLTVMMIFAVAAYVLCKKAYVTGSSMQSYKFSEAGLQKIPMDSEADDYRESEEKEKNKYDNASSKLINTVMSDLKKAGISADKDENNVIIFRYQGGYFHASESGRDLLRIVFPRIYTFSPQNQDFICRILNRINASYAIAKLVAVNFESTNQLEVHGFADIIYKKTDDKRFEVLTEVLSIFFEQQRSLLVASAINDIEMANNAADMPTEYLSAYKDFSIN